MACLVESRVDFSGYSMNANAFPKTNGEKKARNSKPDQRLLDMIVDMTSPSKRMNDQRTRMPFTDQEQLFIELVGSIQCNRIEDQRAVLKKLAPSASLPSLVDGVFVDKKDAMEVLTDEEFMELVLKCQSCRINDQRSPDPETYRRNIMPGEDFFNQLLHLQSARIEDQRSPFPLFGDH